MKTYSVHFSDDAFKDLETIYQHYLLTADNTIANQLLDQLEQAINSLNLDPKRTKFNADLLRAGIQLHELLSQHFRIIYRVNETQYKVFILVILHPKQSISKALFQRTLH
ncbi:hypothetical protein C2869_12935 [Saccharobesus litoralis]|uniref:Plasmid stabilization system protein ParE n=1 Tax=Saccharobesus litoralis TaxID=2172099 RepID=A0A2S0VT68_9ALTE|nr:type II toxin-antitoxin system RelE/ParE family toxin [Saccharobesus litoralis]AWB67290.1 hypothetical protein C2869_12935 [Saccharobesus litoralis]